MVEVEANNPINGDVNVDTIEFVGNDEGATNKGGRGRLIIKGLVGR